jgi:hypothetical protein
LAIPTTRAGHNTTFTTLLAAVGYRRKSARDFQASPLFQAVYMKALAALRNGEFAKSIKSIAEIRDAVNVGRGQVVTPGYVIRLSEPAAKIIEGRADAGESDCEYVSLSRTPG